MRPLRCQHSALPLSYTPTLISERIGELLTRAEPSGFGANSGEGGRWQAPIACQLWWGTKGSWPSTRCTSQTKSLRWNGFETIRPSGKAFSALSAPAEKPVMKITRVSGQAPHHARPVPARGPDSAASRHHLQRGEWPPFKTLYANGQRGAFAAGLDKPDPSQAKINKSAQQGEGPPHKA